MENYKTNANRQNNKNEESDSSPQEQENKNTVQSKTTNNSNEAINESNVNCASVIQQPYVLLWTAKVHVKDINGKLQEFRALLDNGSQSNFVTQQCMSDLGLTATSRITKVSGVSALSSCSEAVITLQIMSLQRIKLPSRLTLVDPEYYKSKKVYMLIGSECFTGQLNLNYNKQNTASYRCTNSNCQSTKTINQVITKFWRVEEFTADRLSTGEDIQFEQIYSSTTSRNQYGRYIIKLPLRSDPAVLGDSFQEALRRFRQIEKPADCKDKYPNADNIIKDFYVDDILCGANAVEEAKKTISELNSMLAKRGFQLKIVLKERVAKTQALVTSSIQFQNHSSWSKLIRTTACCQNTTIVTVNKSSSDSGSVNSKKATVKTLKK
ncbi:hypothetical protein QTP88_023966 [Uroleucon formosanum]